MTAPGMAPGDADENADGGDDDDEGDEGDDAAEEKEGKSEVVAYRLSSKRRYQWKCSSWAAM